MMYCTCMLNSVFSVSCNWLCCSWRWQTGDQLYTKRWWRSDALQCVQLCWHWRCGTGYVQYRCSKYCFDFCSCV